MLFHIRPAGAGRPILAALVVAGGIVTSVPTLAGENARRGAPLDASVVRWLNPMPQKASAQAVRERKMLASQFDRRHGRGSYICSPSGSGSRATCFAR